MGDIRAPNEVSPLFGKATQWNLGRIDLKAPSYHQRDPDLLAVRLVQYRNAGNTMISVAAE